jgi:hypothetical protein
MRTTIEIPDELFRAAKAKAALEGRKLKDLMIEGLQQVVAQPPKRKRKLHTVKFPLIEGKKDGRVITNEMVAQAIEDYYEEEARHYAQPVRR